MISPHRGKQLKELESKLGIGFLNQNLLNQALTHASYAYEIKKKEKKVIADNERLEFLGDAILKLVTSEHLLNKFPTYQEGDLTKIRAMVVSDETLSQVARRFNLGGYLLLGANEKRTGGILRKSNLANAFEALIGATYLDQGIGKTRDLLLDFLKEEIEKVSQVGYIRDYKSTFQEYVQKKGCGLPAYQVTREIGPKHKRIFVVEAKVKGKICGRGKGLSKKEAEQSAARQALSHFKREPGLIRRFVTGVRKRIPLI